MAVRSAVLICGAILLATTAATNARHSDATIVVTKFYSWYLAEHGNVDWYPPQKGPVDWDPRGSAAFSSEASLRNNFATSR